MKILGIITSRTEASARTRIIQYKKPLQEMDMRLHPKVYRPLRYNDPEPWAYTIKKYIGINPWRSLQVHKTITRIPLLVQQFAYDLVWQNRLIIPHQAYFEKKIKKPVVFDFDDAIWLRDGLRQVTAAVSKADMVFAGNSYLAEYAVRHNKNCHIIPTTIDTIKLYPLRSSDEHFVIGWIGTITNFKFLEIAKPAILDFLQENKLAKFMVVSSEPPPQFQFDNERIIFKQWEEEKENEYINQFSIGIMPLAEDDFTLGKCSYKMLQYLACGKPAVVSPVGMNKKVLLQSVIGLGVSSHQEWLDAFRELNANHAFYNECAENGPRLVSREYSVAKFAAVIADCFRDVLNSSKNKGA